MKISSKWRHFPYSVPLDLKFTEIADSSGLTEGLIFTNYICNWQFSNWLINRHQTSLTLRFAWSNQWCQYEEKNDIIQENRAIHCGTRKVSVRFVEIRPRHKKTSSGWFVNVLQCQFHYSRNAFASNSMKITALYSVSGREFTTKFCTCHDSSAVLTCANFCSDHWLKLGLLGGKAIFLNEFELRWKT